MKNLILLILLLVSTVVHTQQITRGPDIGELYFLGPAATDVLYGAIYRSTDFGETAVCMDSISALSNYIPSIAADKTPGGLYFVTMTEQLFYSNNFGQYGSWIYKNSGLYSILCSGIDNGYIFEGYSTHSEDFGNNFINHDLNGLFGGLLWADVGNNSTGYSITHAYSSDSLCFLF